MTLFEKFVMEGHEAADWLAKEGADLDGGTMAAIKAATVCDRSGFDKAAKLQSFVRSGAGGSLDSSHWQ